MRMDGKSAGRNWMNSENDGFPKRLRKLRERHRMDRKALGELCGLSKNMIGRYERGERVPDIYIAREIAQLFEVSMDYLCENDNEKNF